MAPVLGLTGPGWDCRIGTRSSPCGVDLISWGSRIWHWPRFVIFGLQLQQPCVPGCGDCCVDGRALGKCQVLKEAGREEWARTNPSWSRIERNCSLPLNLTHPFLLPVYSNLPKYRSNAANITLRSKSATFQSSIPISRRDDDDDVIEPQRGPASTTRRDLVAV
jgi:hypothetical protein